MSSTPLTDKEERFIYSEIHPAHKDRETLLPDSDRRFGFVSSKFARKLELRIRELESQLQHKDPE
jgi:hypothetical protein